MRSLITVFICLCLLSACGSDTINESDKTDYNEHKNNLANEEKQKPLSFLKVETSDKKNLLGNTVVKGTVSNAATVCSYKEIRLKLLSYDAAGKVMEEHEDMINDVIQPNSSKDFKLRYHLPKGTDSIAVSIMSATVAQQ